MERDGLAGREQRKLVLLLLLGRGLAPFRTEAVDPQDEPRVIAHDLERDVARALELLRA